ncbi:FMN-dependent NADH-azoreductase [Shewanella algidipiscicola]|uniref:FMN-dependent NADH-azoreductase n=1 Tax=Shewanella algidipiscicola TaxID=614070 RepID=UPI000D788B27|nr:FMN-dependent NADH-azoreductase [Shewanella algidipiscicola]
MASVLVLKSSILGEYSQSAKLVDELLQEWQVEGSKVTVRDLAEQTLPVLDGEIALALRGADNLSDKQQQAVAVSDELIAELKAHDTLIIAAPMYNFSIPTQLKNWIDLIARAGVTFTYTDTGPQGLIQGKRAVVVTTRGGVHKAGATDHVVPYLKTVLGFIGIENVDTVYAEALNMGPEAAEQGIQQAQQEIKQLVA